MNNSATDSILRETERLFQISARVNAGLSVSEILDAIFEEFRPVLPYDRMEYTHLEDGGRRLTTAWVRTTYHPTLLDIGHVVEFETPVPESLDTGAPPYLENDVTTYAQGKPASHPAHLLAAEGIRAVLSAPMVVDDRVIGVLFIGSRTEQYDEHHLRLIRYVGSQIAGAIAQSRLRAKLEERNAELELLQSRRASFIATVSHELRNPLTSVVGLSATLRDSMDRLDPEEARSLAGILARESAEVAGIVEDLLTVARDDAGRMQVSAVGVDLKEEVDRVFQAWAGAGESIRVVGPPTGAVGDPLRIRQIIRNLISNAVKYGGSRIDITVSSGAGSAWVEVADDGAEIAESDRERIFEMFSTGSTSRAGRGGVGLGLAVSRQLARLMGGDLEYRHEDGMSRFTLALPIDRGADGTEGH